MYIQHVTQRILVPLDGSELGAVTIPHIRALGSVESELFLLRVLPPEPASGGTSGTGADRALSAHHVESARADLHATARTLADVTPHIRVLVREGAPADEIVRTADEEGANLILIPTRGLGAAASPMISSVASRVAQASPVPVMLIHAQHGALPLSVDRVARYRRVIVPLDGSERARAALPIAHELACHHTLPAQLVHAVSEGPEDVMRDTLASEAARLQSRGVDSNHAVLHGPVVPTLLGEVGPGDIVVLTSHGSGGVRQWLLGSVAEKLVSLMESAIVLVPVEERIARTTPEHTVATNADAGW